MVETDDDYFRTWQPQLESWTPDVSCSLVKSIYDSNNNNNTDLCVTLKLLSKKTVSISCGEGIIGDDVPVNQDKSTKKFPSVMMHSGGVIWTMAWAPRQILPLDAPCNTSNCSYLAVGCHSPRNKGPHAVNRMIQGQNVIEIWEVADIPTQARAAQIPRMKFALLHDGGLTWSLCWSPWNPRGNRLGCLAGALGDGSVRIWALPSTTCFGSGTVEWPQRGEPEPIVCFQHSDVDHSLPSSVDWLPYEPHDLLLVGYWDGCVSIVKLCEDANPHAEVLQYFPANVLPLRSVKWLPSLPSFGSSPDSAHRFSFCVAGHEGSVTVWDARDEYKPRIAVQVTQMSILETCWTTNPIGIMCANEDGSLKGILMDAKAIESQIRSGRPLSSISWRGELPGAFWSVDASKESSLSKKGADTIAYVGEDGVVGITSSAYQYIVRKRREAHIPLVAMWKTGDGHLELKSNADLLQWKKNGGLYEQASVDRKDAMKKTQGNVTDIEQTIHCLKWSQLVSEKSQGRWLAYGNAMGVLHCIWID